jgi:tetratricopeptide (TPR) repeat protein
MQILRLVLICVSFALTASEWESAIKASSALVEQGRYAEAEQQLRTALQLAGSDAQAATAWNNLAGVYVDQGRYHEAQHAYRSSLRLWEKIEGADGSRKANALNGLGGVLVDLGRLQEAERCITRSLALRRSAPEELRPDLAPALNNLALVQLAQRRYREAELTITEAFSECQHERTRCVSAVMPMYHNLGLAKAGMGRYDEAISDFFRAIALGEKQFRPDHPKLRWTYLEAARIYVRLNKDSLAAPLLERILSHGETYTERPDPLLGFAMKEYGRLLRRQNKKEEGKAMSQRADALLAASERANVDRHVVDFATLRSEGKSRPRE